MATSLRIPYKNLELSAVAELPDDNAFPCVLLLHGNTGWKEEEHITSLADGLNDKGIGAFRFDAPGSGESTGTFADDYRLSNYIDSAIVVLRYLRQTYSSITSIGLWGHSMGGLVAVETVGRSNNISALALSQPSRGPVSGLNDEEMTRWQTTGWADFSHYRFPDLRLPYEFCVDRSQYDVRTTIQRIKVPLLAIAGTKDPQVLADVVQSTLFEAANEPKQYLEFPADHQYKHDPEMLEQINNATINFFVTHLYGDSVR